MKNVLKKGVIAAVVVLLSGLSMVYASNSNSLKNVNPTRLEGAPELESAEFDEIMATPSYPITIVNNMNINSNAAIDSVTLYTTSGNVVLTETNAAFVDMANLQPGNYILEIKSYMGIIRKEIVVK